MSLRRRGRVLAVKWGVNPNSSSLGVDVTFLLFGLFFVSLLTPLIGLLLRARRRPASAPSGGSSTASSDGRSPASTKTDTASVQAEAG